MTAEPFSKTLYQELRDDGFAVAYLEDAMTDSTEEFLVALGHVVKARGGVAQVAEGAGLTREAVYRMITPTGNPEFRSVQRMLAATGLRLQVGILGEKPELVPA